MDLMVLILIGNIQVKFDYVGTCTCFRIVQFEHFNLQLSYYFGSVKYRGIILSDMYHLLISATTWLHIWAVS
jgi:hypothetical protein